MSHVVHQYSKSTPVVIYSVIFKHPAVCYIQHHHELALCSASSPYSDQILMLFAMIVDHPCLKKTDATSICAFLRFCDQKCHRCSRASTTAGVQGCVSAWSCYLCASQVLHRRRMGLVTYCNGFHRRRSDL